MARVMTSQGADKLAVYLEYHLIFFSSSLSFCLSLSSRSTWVRDCLIGEGE